MAFGIGISYNIYLSTYINIYLAKFDYYSINWYKGMGFGIEIAFTIYQHSTIQHFLLSFLHIYLSIYFTYFSIHVHKYLSSKVWLLFYNIIYALGYEIS